jgi:hypothetical protein
MQIPMRQYAALHVAGLARDRVRQRSRSGGVEHAFATLAPCAVQRPKSRATECA